MSIADQSEAQANLFFTDGPETGEWQQFIATDPMDTFVLKSLDELDDLKAFVNDHQGLLIAGYFSYDLGVQLLGVNSRHDTVFPLCVLHVYNTWGLTHGEKPELQTELEPFTLQPTLTRKTYAEAIEKIQDYIRAGDFYQINFTQQLVARTTQQPRDLFAHLLLRNPASHACYFEAGNLAIHSLSPELFIHYSNGELITEPIKGTRPRGESQGSDGAQLKALLTSEKEQAELFMITDLLRNDLGKVCETGSVRLEEAKGVKQLPRVWHTHSRIRGKLRADIAPIDALLSMLPGGSISGCPKKRAVEVIDELEDSSRGVYTGCLGYFHPDGGFSFNIAIRTMIQVEDRLNLGAGGGITIDSNWEDEWEELLVKASTFL